MKKKNNLNKKDIYKFISKKKGFFKYNLFSADKNFKLIISQIKKYKPKYFIINDFQTYTKIKNKIKKSKTKIVFAENMKYQSLARSNITLSAIPGLEGLKPTIEMIKKSKSLLIANKESVICGWDLIKKVSKKNKTKIIPIDSEHFSILKLLESHKLKEIKKIYITASGGPFLKLSKKQLSKVTPKDALKHPKWKMGKKISVDSATLMNKILELIEAQKLFNIPIQKLEILIHPDSLVHAILELKNGLTKFIYHKTSMIIPLANAIFDDNLDINEFLNLKKEKEFKDLNFKKINTDIFPIAKIKNRLNEYPSTSVIINASNEILVDQFLSKNLPFLAINKIILAILKDRNYKNYAIRKPNNLKQINIVDKWARNITLKKIKSYAF